MKESELYIPVRDWLQKYGYEVHVEIFGCDIVAVKDDRLTAVELKPCLSSTLFRQLHSRATWADEVWAAIGSEPRGVGGLRGAGFGLLVVKNGRARKKLGPKPQPWQWHKRHRYRFGILTGRLPAMPHEMAGLPSCPALRAQRILRESAAAQLTEQKGEG